MQTLKESLKTIALSLVTLSLIGVAYAWTEPNQNPPNPAGGSTPINTSSTAQIKAGNLQVNALVTSATSGNALIVPSGNVGIGTSSPGAYKLDVAGNLNATQLCIAGSCQSSWPATATPSLQAVTNVGDTTNRAITATRFYDYSNTGYHIDPAGTSNIYKLKVQDTTNTIAAVDTNGSWTWTNVVSNTYNAGAGNRSSGWRSISLDTNRPVLGIKIYGSSDDGGACIVNINSYFIGAVTNKAYITDLDIGGAWTGTAWNNDAGSMATGTFIFDQMTSGRSLGPQSLSDNTAYNKPAGLTYIPAGKTLSYAQWYNDGQQSYYNICYVDVLYGSS